MAGTQILDQGPYTRLVEQICKVYSNQHSPEPRNYSGRLEETGLLCRTHEARMTVTRKDSCCWRFHTGVTFGCHYRTSRDDGDRWGLEVRRGQRDLK